MFPMSRSSSRGRNSITCAAHPSATASTSVLSMLRPSVDGRGGACGAGPACEACQRPGQELAHIASPTAMGLGSGASLGTSPKRSITTSSVSPVGDPSNIKRPSRKPSTRSA